MERTSGICCCMLILLASSFGRSTAADDKVKSKPPSSKVTADHAKKMAAGLKLFKQQVRGVLKARCVNCHGGEEIEGEFDLSTRAQLLKGGAQGPAIVASKATASRMMQMIRHRVKPHMPFEEEKLKDDEIAAIAKWIDLGAPYDGPLVASEVATSWTHRPIADNARKWWAFQPLQRVDPPKTHNANWPKTDVDRFVLFELEARKLTPNPALSKRQLVRRAYFQLIGLPPSPEQIDAFVADTSPNAYKELIDELLASKHFGEKWARHWLDVARFAESHGFEQDYNRDFAFHFRDFVIRSLNDDMPFDQFIRWQLAGDEIAPDDPWALIATGFLGAGVFPTQITANEVERTRYDALDDMAATTGTAMLGLTIGCARCHDHKFDPIPQADYYRFTSTFMTTVRSNIDLDLNPGVYKKAKAKFDADHAPLVADLARFEKNQLPNRFAKWLETGPKNKTPLPNWVVLDLLETKSKGGATFRKLEDGSVLASGTNSRFDTYTFTARTSLTGITSIRLEALTDKSMRKGGPGRAGNGNFALTDFSIKATPQAGTAKPIAVKLSNPRVTFEQKGLPIKATIDNDGKSAWAVDPKFGKNHAAAFDVQNMITFPGGTILTFTLKFENNTGHNIGRPRFSISTAPQPVELKDDGKRQQIVELLAIVDDKTRQLDAKQKQRLTHWYATTDSEWQKRNALVQQHLKKQPKTKLIKVMVCSEGFKPIRHHTQGADFFNKFYFLRRGDCEKKSGEASQSFLQVLMNAPGESNEKHWQQPRPKDWTRTSYRRTALANWITDTKHGAGQLLARVIVNRLWQHHIGRGIVATPNDFGVQGERPTHPELLDWLATELINNGWQLKPLHKLIMTSSVYMQSGKFNADNAKIDPLNKFCWRRTPRRLEAEAVRDSMLEISRLLDTTMYGKGTLDEKHRRRSIYFMIKRSKLIPSMQLFDSPEPLVSVGHRPSTTIAPQALLFMNNANVRKYAQGFANRIEGKSKQPLADVVRQGYLVAIGRKPDSAELTDSVAFIEDQMATYKASKQANERQLALTDFCQVLMSLNEFLYVD